ncbi:unnamed protein product, partial [Mesorhabditis belari]|uniref:Anoctamin n=1 Tax=Mesorhabditis belari TaxID=2138241 RepID=A0AAF3F0A7_9BILA
MNVQSQRSTFFQDGKRQIDFVLVYCEQDNENSKKNKGLFESDTDAEDGTDDETIGDLDTTKQSLINPQMKEITVYEDPLLPQDGAKMVIPVTPTRNTTGSQRTQSTQELHKSEAKPNITRWLSLKSLQNVERRKSRAARYRARFEAKLQSSGLEIELVPPDSTTRRSFILIHCPTALLEVYGELLRIKVPIKGSIISEPFQSDTNIKKQSSTEVVQKKNWMGRIPGKLFEKSFKEDLLQDKKKKRFEPFVKTQRDRFVDGPNHEVFTGADRARIVYYILRGIPFGSENSEKIGIERLLRAGAYTAAYPLHQALREGSELKMVAESEMNQRELLARHWASIRSLRMRQPLDLIRDYFGAKTGLYFAFLGVYTRLLTLASLLGIVWFFAVAIMFVNDQSMVNDVCKDNTTILCPICDSFCDFRKMSAGCTMAQFSFLFDQWGVLIVGIGITIWAQLFLQIWKRAQTMLAYRWGLTDSFYQEHTIRLDFKLHVKTTRRDPVTDIKEPYLTKKKKALNLVVNIVVMIVVAGFIIGASFLTFFLRRHIDELIIKVTKNKASDTFNTLFSSAIVATFHLVIILVFNLIYHLLIYRLVEWECPRTQGDFDNAFIIKIFVAEFFNTNSSLFFVAFIQPLFAKHSAFFSSSSRGLGIRACFSNCFVELSIQMAIIFVGIQLVKAVFGSIIPILIKRGKICLSRIGKWVNKRKARKRDGYAELPESIPQPQWESDFYLLKNEPHFLCYEYAELVMQFSVLVLFAPAFPLAALFALMNNLIEIRADAFKFLRLKQRPVPDEVDSIGIWTPIIAGIVKLSVYVNALLIAFTSEFVPAMKWRFRNGSLHGYSNHSHSVYNTKYLNISSYVITKSDFFDRKTHKMIPQSCRYYGFYTPQCINNESTLVKFDWLNQPEKCVKEGIEFSDEWYYNFSLRLCFAIAFVFMLNTIRALICKLLPDVPQTIADRMAKDKYYARKKLLLSHDPQKKKEQISQLEREVREMQPQTAMTETPSTPQKNEKATGEIEFVTP